MSDSAGGADKPMFDPRSRLDEKHIAILDEFKAKVSQYEMDEEERQYFLDEMCLCRYLRARNYDVDKAYKMITDTIEWRRVNRPDKITLADVEPMARTGCVYINGLDKAGRPIIYARPALEDNLKEPVSTEVKYKHLAYWVEKGFTMMDRNEGVEGFTLITDYKNFGRRHMNMEANNVVMNYLNNHCPERMGKTFFLDPPWLFWIAWKVISPFLSQATLDKVSFIKSSSKGDRRTFPEMFAVIDEAKLEEEYGGQGKYVYDYEEYAKAEQPPR